MIIRISKTKIKIIKGDNLSMELKEFKKLKVGDKVRIVKEKTAEGCGWNRDGLMDKWLGKIMTVREKTFIGTLLMEEDKDEWDGCLSGGFCWSNDMIDSVIKEETIVIKSDGKTVTAYCGKDKGVAVCSPDDEFDLYTGAKLALDRLFGKEEKSEKEKKSGLEPIDISGSGVLYFKDMDTGEWKKLSDVKEVKTVKEIKRPATVGEWIKITDDQKSHGHYKKGDILQVYDRYDGISFNGVFCNLNIKVERKKPFELGYISRAGNLVIWDYEYVVLEGYEPPKEEPKPEVKEVKRPATVGEWIKIVKPILNCGMYKKDDILKVVRLGDYNLTNGGVYCDRTYIIIAGDEYVVLEGYQPE